MGIPQIIIIVWLALANGYAIAKHDTERNEIRKWNDALYPSALIIAVLYWGGFFG